MLSIIIFLSDLQFLKTPFSKVSMFSGIVIVSRFLHPSNALSSININFSFKAIFFKFSQSLNAFLEIDSTFLGNLTSSIFLFPSNAPSPIYSTSLGISTTF